MTGARGTWVRAAALVLLLAAALVAALVVELPGAAATRAAVEGAGPLGWVGLTLAVALVLLAPVPRTAVSVLVGLVAGFWAGLAIAYAGGVLAALGAFALSRGLGRAAVQRLAGPRSARVDRVVTGRAFFTVLTARLLPVAPFPAVNYGIGLSGARVAPYLGATVLGMLPSTVAQVGLGASAGLLLEGTTGTLTAVAGAVLLVALVSGTVLWRRRRAVAAS